MNEVLQGCIDFLTADGYVQGWAFDSDDVLNPKLVYVLAHGDQIIARGLANHFRQALVAAQCGVGWCGFSLRATCPVSFLQDAPLSLVDALTARVLYKTVSIAFTPTSLAALVTVDEVKSADPTLVTSIDQLDGCDLVFDHFIKLNGVENFVRAAYAYILSRPVDAKGLEYYVARIRQGSVAPRFLLMALGDTEEFRSSERRLGSPMTASFPFRPFQNV